MTAGLTCPSSCLADGTQCATNYVTGPWGGVCPMIPDFCATCCNGSYVTAPPPACAGTQTLCGPGVCNNNGLCDSGETFCNCPSDCSAVCGDGCVTAPEQCEPPGTPTCDLSCQNITIATVCNIFPGMMSVCVAGECCLPDPVNGLPYEVCVPAICDPANVAATCKGLPSIDTCGAPNWSCPGIACGGVCPACPPSCGDISASVGGFGPLGGVCNAFYDTYFVSPATGFQTGNEVYTDSLCTTPVNDMFIREGGGGRVYNMLSGNVIGSDTGNTC